MTSPVPVRPWRVRAIALALLIAGWGVPLGFPHLAADDVLCIRAESGEGHAAVGASASTRNAEHCDVCHAQRPFRTADLAERLLTARFIAVGVPMLPPPAAARSADALQLPARAPPSA